MDYPIEVRATAGNQGIDYQVTAGGQPVSDFLDYDGMKTFVMRIADSQYDAELTALEVAAAAKANEITMQLNANIYELLAQGKVDLGLAEYKAEADAVLAALNAQFEAQGQGMKLTELAETSEGKVLVTDELGRVYEVKTSQRKIGGKMQDITSLELVDVEGLSE
jgi:multidrug efflux pump subunit AcrA (membrane-fusion protein)